jgi:hypothetical protein
LATEQPSVPLGLQPFRRLSPKAAGRGVDLDRAILYGIEEAQRRHDFTGGKKRDLETVVGDLADPSGETLADAVRRIE